MTRRGLPLAERFGLYTIPEPNTGCLLWIGASIPDGYGSICVNGVMKGAHRVAWELVHGPLSVEIQVLHRCDNPPCVELSHLFLGDHSTNMQDRALKGRHWKTRVTACPSGHPYDERNTHLNSVGARVCRACKRLEVTRRRKNGK